VEVSPGKYVVLMAPYSWHTVRFSYNDVSLTWRLIVDGLTDDRHQIEGIVSGSSGGPYVQWGVLSSGNYAHFYTRYVYWGQNDEIDNWPANKIYDASTGQDPAVNPGWGLEGGGSRAYEAIGTERKSIQQAIEDGWLEQPPVYYDGGYKVVRTAGGDDTSLRAWFGYWLKANRSGLSLILPGPAAATDPGSDMVSRVRLALEAADCLTSSFTAGMATTASDVYEPTYDAAFPPAGPADMLEVRFGTTLDAELILEDIRSEPPTGQTKIWLCTATPIHFSPGQCKQVTVTWDLTDAGDYGYKLVDLGQSTSIVLSPGGQYTFQICEQDQLSFELHAKQGGFPPETVRIESVQTVADHGAAGELGLAVNLSASTLPADTQLVTTESRDEGIHKLLIDCDGDVTLPDPPEDLVESIVGVNSGDVTGNVVSVTAAGDVITINLSPLPDEDTYTITLSASVIEGDRDFMIRALQCEVDNAGTDSQLVNALDLSAVRAHFGADVSADDNARYDIVSDGVINALDLSQCRQTFTHTAP